MCTVDDVGHEVGQRASLRQVFACDVQLEPACDDGRQCDGGHARQDGRKAHKGEQLTGQLLEAVEPFFQLLVHDVDVLVDRSQVALEVWPLLHDLYYAHALQTLDNKAQVALSPALHAGDFGDASVAKDILLCRLSRVALIDGLIAALRALDQQPSVDGSDVVVVERHAGNGDGGVRLRGRADAVDLGEDGGDVGAVGDGDLDGCAGKDGERRREGDERQHLGARLARTLAHCGTNLGELGECVWCVRCCTVDV